MATETEAINGTGIGARHPMACITGIRMSLVRLSRPTIRKEQQSDKTDHSQA